MWYILTFMAGSMFGIFFMCLFQINTNNIYEDYNSGTANSQGGFDEKD